MLRQTAGGDYEEIAGLHLRNHHPIRAREDWLRIWQGNPAFEPRQDSWPMGWVLVDQEGRIVGSIGTVPAEFLLAGRRLLASVCCAWVVDRAFRGHALRLLLKAMRQPVDLVLSTTVSASAEPAMRALGWERVPIGSWDHAEYWLTNRIGFLKALAHSGPRVIASVATHPADAMRSLLNLAAGTSIRQSEPESGIDVCSGFDEKWDEFWQELSGGQAEKLLAVRSRATLEWHFSQSAKESALWIVRTLNDRRMDAYAVFDRWATPANGMRKARLVDCQWLEGAAGKVPALLSWMLRTCLEEEMHVLEISGGWLPSEITSCLRAPYRRGLSSWTYYYRACHPALSKALEDPAVWAPTAFDGDASI